MTEKRILVTGGNGRLGRAVLQALGTRGIPGVRRRARAKGAILIDANGSIAPQELAGIYAIINCAGRVTGTPDEIEQANIIYPATLARSARAAGVRRFVQVSSFSIFGRTDYIDAETPFAPEGVYGQSKLSAEQELAEFDNVDFRTIPLRLPFMFSVDNPALLGRLVSMMLRLRVLPTLAERASQRSVITYAGAADALISLASNSNIPQGALAAADPEPLKLLTIAGLIHERLARRIRIVPVPQAAVSIAARVLPTFVDRLFGSNVLSPSSNLILGSDRHRAEVELASYLDRLATNDRAG